MISKIIVANHLGFCMGVERAIEIADRTARNTDGPVTILKEIVHNHAIVKRFRRKKVLQAVSLQDVKEGTLIVSAHGAAPGVLTEAKRRGLVVVDATCPLVSCIYKIINKLIGQGYRVIHYGDPDHDETKGVVGQAPESISVVNSLDDIAALPKWTGSKLGLTVQTTAQRSEFETIQKAATEKYEQLEVFDTICNATTLRQAAARNLAPLVNVMLVVGSETSANSKRLAQISAAACDRAELIDNASDIVPSWFEDTMEMQSIGVTAGASTPDFLVDEVIDRLLELSDGRAEVIRPDKRNELSDDEPATD